MTRGDVGDKIGVAAVICFHPFGMVAVRASMTWAGSAGSLSLAFGSGLGSGLLHANGLGFRGFIHSYLRGNGWMDGVGLASVMRQHSPVRFGDCNKLCTIIGLALSSLSLQVRWMRLELGELDDLAKLAVSSNQQSIR